jgi:hypothetical protein
MTTRAVMELAWQANAWAVQNSAEPELFIKRWCADEFGAAATVLQDYYRAYFQAPARYGGQEDETMADNFYQTAARRLLLNLIAGEDALPVELPGIARKFSNLQEMGTFLAKITEEADPRWQKARLLAEKARPLVPAGRQGFFQAHILSQIDIHLHSNRMVFHLAQAAPDLAGADQLSKLSAALEEGEKLQGAMRAAEYGQWQGFYTSGDWLLDVPLTMALMKAYRDKLERRTVPAHVLEWAKDSAFAYTMIKAYQGGERDQF